MWHNVSDRSEIWRGGLWMLLSVCWQTSDWQCPTETDKPSTQQQLKYFNLSQTFWYARHVVRSVLRVNAGQAEMRLPLPLATVCPVKVINWAEQASIKIILGGMLVSDTNEMIDKKTLLLYCHYEDWSGSCGRQMDWRVALTMGWKSMR